MSYFKAAEEIEEKVANENIQLLLQIQMGVEHYLESLDNSVSQFILSPFFLSNFEKKITSEDFTIYREFSSSMKRFTTTNFLDSDVKLINYDKNWMISKEGLNQLSIQEYFEGYSQLNDITYASGWVTFPMMEENSVNLVRKLPLLSKDPKGLIIVSIPKKRIKELINVDKMTPNLIILDDKYRIISTSFSNAPLIPTEGIINELEMTNSMSGYFTLKYNGKHMGINFSKSDYNGWYYLSLVSIDALTKESRDIGWYTAAVCFAMLVIIIFAAHHWSRHLHHPVQNLYESILSLSDLNTNLKPNDEFLWIQNGISNFKKREEQYKRHLHDHLDHLREYFVLKLILGQVKSKGNNALLSNLRFPQNWNSLSVLAIQIDTLEDTNFFDDDKELLLFSVNNMVNEMLDNDERLTPVYLDEFQITIILNNEEDHEDIKKKLYNIANKIKNKVLNQFGLKISIGISRPYSNIEDTNKAYEEGIEALSKRQTMNTFY